MSWLFCLIVVVSVGQGVAAGPGCSWKAFPSTNILGGTPTPAASLTDCQSACLAVSGCVSLDYDPKTRGCWIFFTQDGKIIASGIDHYDYVCTEIDGSLMGPRDCSDIRALGNSVSGVYQVYPGSSAKRMKADVYCDMTTPGGNWLVFQRRKDGSLNFERSWSQYAKGFGKLDGEFWLGNEILYLLTSNRNYKLRIDMEDFDGQKRYAEYAKFSISSSADNYKLTATGYSGNAGDSLSRQNGMQFSTKDVDNDLKKDGSCSKTYRGAWWYASCHDSNLNGLYLGGPHKKFGEGIEWLTFRGSYYSLKTTEMKIAALT